MCVEEDYEGFKPILESHACACLKLYYKNLACDGRRNQGKEVTSISCYYLAVAWARGRWYYYKRNESEITLEIKEKRLEESQEWKIITIPGLILDGENP